MNQHLQPRERSRKNPKFPRLNDWQDTRRVTRRYGNLRWFSSFPSFVLSKPSLCTPINTFLNSETPGGLSAQFPFLLPPNIARPVPLATPYKAPLTLLSRKPAPRTITKIDPQTGKKITVEAEEEEEVIVAGPSAEELREKAQREREEKQRKYDEARARILGTSASPRSNSGNGRGGSGGNSPRNGTPPLYDKGRGRGRGNEIRRPENRADSRTGQKELFDPNYTPKPGLTTTQKATRSGEGSRSGSGTSTPTSRENDQVIRAPRGPDATGKGFGFANRGGKTS